MKDTLKCFIWEEVYFIYTTIYLIKLNALNNIIRNMNTFDLLLYKNGLPIFYFLLAIILVAIGSFLGWRLIKELFDEEYNLKETLIIGLVILLIFVFIILIFIFINNPILRAIISAIVVLAGYIFLK